MTIYEYKLLHVYPGLAWNTVEDSLNQLAGEGWSLRGVCEHLVIMERVKGGEAGSAG